MKRNADPLWPRLATEAATFALHMALIVATWRNNPLLLALLTAEGIFLLVLWHTPRDVGALILIGGLGTLAELVFVRAGVWRYTNPTVLGLPIWFSIAFGVAGMIGVRLSVTAALIWERFKGHRLLR